jgi:putative DNA primase/helicase
LKRYNPNKQDTRPSPYDSNRRRDANGPKSDVSNDRNGAIPENLEDRLEQDLSPEHLLMLREESGISPQDILARGYFTASDSEQLGELGFADYQLRTPALIIPVHGVKDGPLFYRARPDRPRERKDDPGKSIKYEQPAGTGVVLDVPPRARPMLSDASKRLWVVEDEKKADSLVSHGECAVALLGAWSWKSDGLPLQDWDDIRLVGREVIIAFDSDAERKAGVRVARQALAEYLKGRGVR